VAGRAGFEPATGLTQHSLSRRAHSATLAPPHTRSDGFKLAGAQLVLKPIKHLDILSRNPQRREWDSNPRWLAPNMFSRHAPSAARSSLHRVPTLLGGGSDFTIRLTWGNWLHFLLYFANTLMLNYYMVREIKSGIFVRDSYNLF
jgi:hypothetical protein